MPVEEVSTNESTVNTPEKIEVGPGEMFTSFDDLDNVRNLEKTDNKPEKVVKKESKPEDKAGEDGEKPSKADKDQEKEAKETKPDAKKSEKDKLAQGKAEAKRTVKFKNGEEEAELPATAEVTVKVAGKEEVVKVEDLINNYSGKKAWSDEFGKLGAEKQRFKQERDIVIGKLGEMFETAKQDPMAGFMKMAEMAGMDPMQWRKDFLDALNPVLEKRMEMTDAERRAADAEAEAAYYRSQTQSRLQSEQQEREFREFEAKVTQMVASAGLTNQEFEVGYQNLMQAVQQGLYKPRNGEIGPEDVVRVVQTEKVLTAAESALEDLGLSLEESQKEKFFAEFIPMARDKRLSAQDIKEVVKLTFGDMKAATLSKKIRKSQPEKVTQAAARAVNPGSDPLTFDDL